MSFISRNSTRRILSHFYVGILGRFRYSGKRCLPDPTCGSLATSNERVLLLNIRSETMDNGSCQMGRRRMRFIWLLFVLNQELKLWKIHFLWTTLQAFYQNATP